MPQRPALEFEAALANYNSRQHSQEEIGSKQPQSQFQRTTHDGIYDFWHGKFLDCCSHQKSASAKIGDWQRVVGNGCGFGNCVILVFKQLRKWSNYQISDAAIITSQE
jgi:hypothetical protein